jgi:DNA-binding winged helix-turn-helix (wHTH) protein
MLFAMPTNSRRIFRFGAFEADPVTGELRKSGIRIHLQEQPFQVLLVLLERPGELVSREELRQRLWPSDTFVDFDHSLNTVVNKLRDALGDTAANPRFIETSARRGYRFLAPVQTNGESERPASAATAALLSPEPQPVPAARIADSSSLDFLLTAAHEVPRVRPRYVRILFALIQIMYLAFYIVALARLPRVADLIDSAIPHPDAVIALLVVSGLIGIPVRLYLLAAVAFKVENLVAKFRKIFLLTFPLDQLWALSPFLLVPQIGIGLALAASAALVYVPFSQRTLLLMGHKHAATESNSIPHA